MMTKAEFLKLRTKCPWYYTSHGEPKCMAQQASRYYQRHCSINNCAVAYWLNILEQVRQITERTGKPLDEIDLRRLRKVTK